MTYLSPWLERCMSTYWLKSFSFLKKKKKSFFFSRWGWSLEDPEKRCLLVILKRVVTHRFEQDQTASTNELFTPHNLPLFSQTGYCYLFYFFTPVFHHFLFFLGCCCFDNTNTASGSDPPSHPGHFSGSYSGPGSASVCRARKRWARR